MPRKKAAVAVSLLLLVQGLRKIRAEHAVVGLFHLRRSLFNRKPKVRRRLQCDPHFHGFRFQLRIYRALGGLFQCEEPDEYTA